jgi:hypothetical protein
MKFYSAVFRISLIIISLLQAYISCFKIYEILIVLLSFIVNKNWLMPLSERKRYDQILSPDQSKNQRFVRIHVFLKRQ